MTRHRLTKKGASASSQASTCGNSNCTKGSFGRMSVLEGYAFKGVVPDAIISKISKINMDAHSYVVGLKSGVSLNYVINRDDGSVSEDVNYFKRCGECGAVFILSKQHRWLGLGSYCAPCGENDGWSVNFFRSDCD